MHLSYNEKSWGYVETCVSPDWPWDWFSLSPLSSLMSACWLIPEPFSIWNQNREWGGERERERGQVKQYPNAFELTNYIYIYIYSYSFYPYRNIRNGFSLPLNAQIWTLIRCEGMFSRLSKLNFLRWLRGSPMTSGDKCRSFFWSMEC